MADMTPIMRFKLNGVWNVPGFDPMTTEEFADLLRRIDQAQFVAELEKVKP